MLFHQGRIVSDNDVAGSGFCDGQSRGFLLSVAFTHHGAACDYVKGGKTASSGQQKALCKGSTQRSADNAGGVHRPGNRQVFFGKGLSLGCIVNGINGGQIGYHGTHGKGAVSYTHLDVYKRQVILDVLCNQMEGITGGKLMVETEIDAAAEKIAAVISDKRRGLGLNE